MPKNHQQLPSEHLPVLAKEVLDCLKPTAGESYLDLTAGYGGHAQLILEHTHSPGNSLLVDRDEQAIAALKRKIAGVPVRHSDFLGICQKLVAQGKQFNMILADLGASSPHFDKSERGFSFQHPGPLDMRMDMSQSLTAAELVNMLSETDLEKILRDYGEEPKAGAIAKAIRQSRPFTTTDQLAEVVKRAVGRLAARRKIHPATRTFQALRIAVNDELVQLEQSLPLMIDLLAPGGRLAIISFHSLEDRLVKRFFQDHAGDTYDAQLRLLTKKPLTATLEEININPRARSAKLRAVAKIKI